MRIRLLVSGRFYDAAATLPRELELAEDASLGAALAAIQEQLPGEATLPGSCLISVSGQHVGTVARHDERTLKAGDELMLIAPVSGG